MGTFIFQINKDQIFRNYIHELNILVAELNIFNYNNHEQIY